jgi:hypothetical protein
MRNMKISNPTFYDQQRKRRKKRMTTPTKSEIYIEAKRINMPLHESNKQPKRYEPKGWLNKLRKIFATKPRMQPTNSFIFPYFIT